MYVESIVLKLVCEEWLSQLQVVSSRETLSAYRLPE
jgi:hypothetical protein